MSWKDVIDNPYRILCGDGKAYVVIWDNAVKSKEFNVSEYEFIKIAGSLVKRKTVKGTKFPLSLYFTGDDHLDQALAFWDSASDPRTWTIFHPLYGAIDGHPLNLTFDNKDMNVTKVTGMFAETIPDSGPKLSINPVDKINSMKLTLDETVAFKTSINVPVLNTKLRNQFRATAISSYTEGVKGLKNTIDSDAYTNAFSDALSAIDNVTAGPLETMRKMQALLNLPFQFVDTVENRLSIFEDQFDQLRRTLGAISSPGEKSIFEANAETLVSGLAMSSVTNYDYTNREQVFSVIERINTRYDQMNSDLDSIQTDNGGEPDSYIPDDDSLNGLADLVKFTNSNLYGIAINSKQERSVFLEADSNWILICHRFFGLDPDDKNIQLIMDINNATLDEMLIVPKDRKITYYV